MVIKYEKHVSLGYFLKGITWPLVLSTMSSGWKRKEIEVMENLDECSLQEEDHRGMCCPYLMMVHGKRTL
jgi:hypothetical protein